MTEPNATLDVTVNLIVHSAGNHAGKLVTVGRRGQVRPKLSTDAHHGGSPWTARIRRWPVEHGEAVSVIVQVPWRTSAQSLTDEETARVLDLVREQVGEYTVID